MTFDAYLDGRLLAQNLMIATVEDLCKLAVVDVAWAIEEHGVCCVLDDSDRQLEFVAHGDDLTEATTSMKGER